MRPECDSSWQCTRNCCISLYAAPFFFITFVLFAQFVLVNIVIAVLMKHLRVTKLCKGNLHSRKNSVRKPMAKEEMKQDPGRTAFAKWQKVAGKRKTRRDDMLEMPASYVRTKRSTDGLDGIQLRQYRNHLEDELEKNQNEHFVNNNINKRELCDDFYENELSSHRDNEVKSKYLWQRNSSFKNQIDLSPDMNKDKKENKSEFEENLVTTKERAPNVATEEEIEVSYECPQFAEQLIADESTDFCIEVPEEDINISESLLMDEKEDCCCCDACESSKSIDLSEIESATKLSCDDFMSDYNDDKGQIDNSELLNDLSEMEQYLDEENCDCEERISFTGSQVLAIPDDFFSEDETSPLKSSKCLTDTQGEKQLDIEKATKRKRINPKLGSFVPKSESIETCGSFEILPESLELCQRTGNADGSNESFALVYSDGLHLKTSKV